MEHLSSQIKFLSFIQSSLEMFKQKNSYLWNFRCPYCGDSQRDTRKARGYLYKNKQGLLSFQCHNCGENHHFRNFLKYLNPHYYSEYVLENFKNQTEEFKEDANEKNETPNLSGWEHYATRLKDLSKLHIATKYVRSRRIPEHHLDKFWYTDNLQQFANHVGIDMVLPEDPRILIVETDRFGQPDLIVARSILKTSELKYITLKLKEGPKVFGLKSIDHTKPVYLMEGCIDSLFIENGIAALDANLLKYEKEDLGINNVILIWDNEPRSRHTVNRMEQAIKKGHKIVIFPSNIHEKDINEMVNNGIDIEPLIKQRTFSGVEALLQFQMWKRTHDKKYHRN